MNSRQWRQQKGIVYGLTHILSRKLKIGGKKDVFGKFCWSTDLVATTFVENHSIIILTKVGESGFSQRNPTVMKHFKWNRLKDKFLSYWYRSKSIVCAQWSPWLQQNRTWELNLADCTFNAFRLKEPPVKGHPKNYIELEAPPPSLPPPRNKPSLAFLVLNSFYYDVLKLN